MKSNVSQCTVSQCTPTHIIRSTQTNPPPTGPYLRLDHAIFGEATWTLHAAGGYVWPLILPSPGKTLV